MFLSRVDRTGTREVTGRALLKLGVSGLATFHDCKVFVGGSNGVRLLEDGVRDDGGGCCEVCRVSDGGIERSPRSRLGRGASLIAWTGSYAAPC